jgi:hypothetical protein
MGVVYLRHDCGVVETAMAGRDDVELDVNDV